ncbi:hypothetical protein B0H94_101189 [Salsuginibacillus halophilus]|uniref:Uncharacterized protein n=1 Tax=Salsuginibacillus halophilus TaxID=517424 RepID=A0A2P8HYJ0_9BACI|nr:hypothetical protein [Salsuginibacillus halophilus]PSL51279.1 hypothetical protein B0H94_101189 [Salsuginibacillus halophilus]
MKRQQEQKRVHIRHENVWSEQEMLWQLRELLYRFYGDEGKKA